MDTQSLSHTHTHTNTLSFKHTLPISLSLSLSPRQSSIVFFNFLLHSLQLCLLSRCRLVIQRQYGPTHLQRSSNIKAQHNLLSTQFSSKSSGAPCQVANCAGGSLCGQQNSVSGTKGQAFFGHVLRATLSYTNLT